MAFIYVNSTDSSENRAMKDDTLALIVGLVMFATPFFVAGIAVGAALC